jgi:hypothetical protein
MKTTLLALVLLLTTSTALPQIRSAEDRIRRERNNSREALTLGQVAANKIDLQGKVFFFKIWLNDSLQVEQIEANRWKVPLNDDNGVFECFAHFPRAGAEVLGTLQVGDVVIARLKADEPSMVLEILGVSEVGVWQ